MSWMRKMTEYLGLAPDEEYDDVYDEDERDERATGQNRAPGRTAPLTRPSPLVQPEVERSASVRALPVQPVVSAYPDEDRGDRVVARPQATNGPVMLRPQERAVAKPQVVSPESFGSAQEVADKFKANRPVIMNLQGVDRDLRRRLIDFASGLCYGLGGQMDKVGDQVFLLTPADVEVPEEERRRLRERGFDDGR